MSRNYQEDQNNEIEALDSIYCGDMQILEKEPFHKFQIPIATEEFNKETQENGLSCYLVFTYTPTYPDEAPVVEVDEPVNFQEDYEQRMLEHLKSTIEENIGMEMIFTLVSTAQEWLNERWDDFKKAEEDERERRLLEAEEAERKRFEGTRVTVETFMKWKMEFEESMGIAAKREKSNDNKKLTGRELFMRDNTLNDSDIKFLMEAGDSIENVKIDESLFQAIDDIDLDDDDDDDEDWVPGDESD
ncbi:RWD domain-containing protein 1 [Musca domestica]|uniref:RWD domain protein n=1 Tax=Musca domestica TaxID=7370 RepID=T1PM15_MUSDO|nr:RWD domain-containing protein 1 [Musca domestica]XP_058983948.1 RWD domain-containing protein 1 [Musca domestica]